MEVSSWPVLDISRFYPLPLPRAIHFGVDYKIFWTTTKAAIFLKMTRFVSLSPLNTPPPKPWNIITLNQTTAWLLSSFNSWKINHIPCEANMAAYYLSNLSLMDASSIHIWTHNFPQDLLRIIADNCSPLALTRHQRFWFAHYYDVHLLSPPLHTTRLVTTRTLNKLLFSGHLAPCSPMSIPLAVLYRYVRYVSYSSSERWCISHRFTLVDFLLWLFGHAHLHDNNRLFDGTYNLFSTAAIWHLLDTLLPSPIFYRVWLTLYGVVYYLMPKLMLRLLVYFAVVCFG